MAIFKGNSGNNKLNGTTGRDSLFGFGGIDTLNGGGGDDKLDGGLGIDILSGGSGNDTYIIDNTSDKTIELANAGTDLVQSSVSFTLAANIENLTLTGSSAINGTGQLLNNLIIGNDAANKLIGNGGNDILNGKTGIDSLYGGTGDDLLKINEFNGDIIDGGVGKNDALEIFGPDQYFALWDSITFEITGIEKIIFSGGGNNVLELTGSSVLDQSSESNILTVDGDAGDTLYLNGIGWQDGGFQGSYQVFTLGDAVVKASVALGDIVMPDTPVSYTISDATTAEQVGSFFTDGADEVVIDFGGIQYNETGLLYGEIIDLSGFGLEDKLIIASHDGQLHNGTASYAGIPYISEYSGSEEFHHSDAVYWQPGSTSASLRSAKKTHQFTPTGSLVYSTTSFTIQLTGLPAGLAGSQFVFV